LDKYGVWITGVEVTEDSLCIKNRISSHSRNHIVDIYEIKYGVVYNSKSHKTPYKSGLNVGEKGTGPPGLTVAPLGL